MSKHVMNEFYDAFEQLDAEAMGKLYHPDAVFNDPAFTHLNAKQAAAMWKMLIERSKGDLTIEHHSFIGDDQLAECTWEATYTFSKTKNRVHNIIHSSMVLKDGLIFRHTDTFDFWRWSKMALGLPGLLLGWTPFLKKKVQTMAMKSLHDYMEKN